MEEAIQYHEIAVRSEGSPPCLVVGFVHEDLRNPHIISTLEGELAHLMDRNDIPRIVIDFSQVSYAPSAVLGLTIQLISDARKREQQVRLCHVHPSIRKALELISTKLQVQIVDTLRIALHAEWEGKKKPRRRRRQTPWWRFWEK